MNHMLTGTITASPAYLDTRGNVNKVNPDYAIMTETPYSIIVSVPGTSASLCFPYNEKLMEKLLESKIVKVSYSWDAEIKEIAEQNKSVQVCLVRTNAITKIGMSKEDRIEKLKAAENKIQEELNAIRKQQDEISNS